MLNVWSQVVGTFLVTIKTHVALLDVAQWTMRRWCALHDVRIVCHITRYELGSVARVCVVSVRLLQTVVELQPLQILLAVAFRRIAKLVEAGFRYYGGHW